MRVPEWLDEPVVSLLDVGCNVGAWLADCARRYPNARLAGVEINEPALERARTNVPTADLHLCGAERLPFADESFQYVTCFEVLEHLPPDLRPAAFREMRRVLKPDGKLVMSVPHAGWFAWLDSNNVRFRLPSLYGLAVGVGKRDAGYAAMGRHVEWHHHFTLGELEQIAGEGWELTNVRRGGLLLVPIADWFSWPFYRMGKSEHPARRFLERVSGWDRGIDFGRASYGIRIVMRRVDRALTAGAESAPGAGSHVPAPGY